MGLAHSPQVVTDGLVFYYDMGNPQKSWRGAPTTNLQLPNVIDWSNSATVSLVTSEVSPINTPVYAVTDNNTSWLSCNRNITVPNNSNTYTLSIYIKKTYGATSAMLGFNSGFSGGTTVALSQRFNSDTGVGNSGTVDDLGTWWRWKFSLTNNSTGNTTLYCSFFPATGFYNSGDNATATGTALVSAVQIEQNAFATPFVNGTRSNTQAILDLTGNNTVTATSLTYNSDGSFSFNGSNDEMHPPINHSYLSSSALEVIFRSTSHGSGFKTIIGYRHNSGFSIPTIGSLYLNSNNLSASVIAASQVYRTATSSVSIATNTFYHVVLNKNTSSGLLEIYVNGVLTGSQTFDAATFGQWTSAGQFIGADILDIGKSTNTNSGQGWATDFFNGIIPVAKVYNRVLTAAEVQQNFNALRGRYGI
jgi:hypothetical protein